MNVLSYKEKRPLRIAAALILALAMMVTAMPMTVIAQTVTTASQAAETNEMPAQASEAEEAPLAENAAFEEKAEAEENSDEAAAPEAQQETSEEIKTETTVAETSSETRKAQEKALPEKSGDNENGYPYDKDYEDTTGYYGDQVGDGDSFVYLRYFFLEENGKLFEITGYKAKYHLNADPSNSTMVDVWAENYYDYYHGEKINLTSFANNPLDVAYKMVPATVSGDNRGVGLTLNFAELEGNNANTVYDRYSVSFAIGPSRKQDEGTLNYFTDTYERTKFFQFHRPGYYGPSNGGPYLKPGSASGSQDVQWSFSGNADDFRTYGVSNDGNVPAVYVVFKRADVEYDNDTKLVIDHKALQDAEDINNNNISLLNGNGVRTVSGCEITATGIGFNKKCEIAPTSGKLVITENSLINTVKSSIGDVSFNSEEYEYKFRVQLSAGEDELGDVYVQTHKKIDDTELYSTYREVTNNASTSPIDINSVKWVDAGNGWYETDLVNIYRLLDSANDGDLNNGNISSNNVITETLYSNAASENFTVTFKYYDKDRSAENSNKPADVSYTPTVVPVNTTLPGTYSSDAMSNVLAAAKASCKISNNLDTIAFNTTDQGYEDLLDGMDNSPCHGGGYYSYYGGTQYHTDWYGRVYGDTENYMKENPLSANELPEKWVTYYDVAGEEITKDVYTATGFDKHRISNVVIWGYNFPRMYVINYAVPDAYSQLIEYQYTDQNNDSQTIYLASENNSNIINRSFCYNQRIGNEYIKSNANEPDSTDPRNSVSNHLTQWGLTDVNGISLDPDDDSPAVIAEDEVPGRSDLVFDGWYVNRGDKDSPEYVKVSSDKEYTGRVLGDMNLIAGYKQKTVQQNTDCGFTITSVNTEAYYTEEGQARTIITTVLNSYGYPDGDPNLNEKKAAIIYFINDVRLTPYANNVAELINEDTTFKANVEAALKYPRNPNKVMINHVHGDGQTSVDLGNNFPGICYYYIMDTTDPDEGDDGTGQDTDESGVNRILKLTNKNRAQFMLDMPSDKLGGNGAYRNLIVLVAVEHDTNEGTELVLSDNYINYVDVSDQALN